MPLTMLESTTMKSRFALMLIALLPLFAACSKQADEAATPAVETVAAPATTAPAVVAPAAEAASARWNRK